MKRSMAELRMKGEAAPYYIAYEVLDRTISDVSGRLGAIVENPPRRTRTLRVEVRVGDYTFDSSRFVVQGFGGAALLGETVIAPLDDDYDAMRREIWLTTDVAYKRAITMFARKKAAFQNRTASDPIPDFSAEPPVETILPAPRFQPDRAGVLARVQQSSAVFASHPDVDLSEVSISQVHGTRYYLNSEGFKTVAPIQIASLAMYGEAQAGDGMPVRQTFTDVGRTVADLPSAADLVARAKQIGADVDAARAAPIGEEFAGPVMVEGVGGAQFVAETLVQMMQARRPPDAENPRMGQVPPSPFLNRTGLRVMADAFSASDTPSVTHFEGKPLAGSYAVDDEGMRAKDVTLVEKGRLAALLTGRVPQKNFPRSNGHGRSTTVLAGRVPNRERAGDSVRRAQGQVHRAAQSAGQDVRLHRAGRAIGRPGRRHRSRHRLDCEGDARRPGESRPRHALRCRLADGVQRPCRGLQRAACLLISRGRHLGGVRHRTEPHLRRARDSAGPRHPAEAPVVPSPLKTLNVQ